MDTPEDHATVPPLAGSRHVPSLGECEAILAAHGLGEPMRRHCRTVAAVAVRLAQALGERGVDLDVPLVRAAAMLHDLAKGRPDHARVGAELVAGLGYAEVARVVATHTDLAFAGGVPDEAAIVYCADKCVREDRMVSSRERFERSFERFRDDPCALEAARQRFEANEKVIAAVEQQLGRSVQQVLQSLDMSRLGNASADDAAGTENERRLAATGSVCPVCLARIPAERVARGENVYLRKACPEHGPFSTVLWRGAPAYESWGASSRPASTPRACAAETKRGCPFDCGLCPDHRQTTCCVLVEVTNRCNLSCPVCFADSGPATAEPGLDEIEQGYRMLLATGGKPNIQLSGGEPTLRHDLPEIIALARSLKFPFVQVNTNGIRLAEDATYVRRLKEAGLGCVFLQFDGVDDDVYRRLRGVALLDKKLTAIRNCAEQQVGVVLVPTLVPGVNTSQIGEIIRFAVTRMPAVRAVHFQPVSYFGRYPHEPRNCDRITLPEVIRGIEEQTEGAIRAADLHAPSAENPHCSFQGRFVVAPGGLWQSSARPSAAKCCGSATRPANAPEAAERSQRFVARHWAFPGFAVAAETSSCCGANVSSFDAFLEAERQTLSISGMAFQDAWNLDLDRLRECFLHVVGPDRKLVPLCAYNLTSRDGRAIYRRTHPG
jgi:hypothetical protein